MKASFSHRFIVACGLIAVALGLSLMGIIVLALPLGLAGGYLLIIEMVQQYRQ